MVVDYLHIERAWRSRRPLKTNSPLIVDADTVLPVPIPNQPLETIAGQCSQIGQHNCSIEPVQFQAGYSLKASERLHALSRSKVSGALISVTGNQT